MIFATISAYNFMNICNAQWVETYNNKQFSITKRSNLHQIKLIFIQKNTEIEYTIGQTIQTNIFLLSMIMGLCLNVYTLLIKKMIHLSILLPLLSLFASPFTISEDVF